jgi:hypothetical protein
VLDFNDETGSEQSVHFFGDCASPLFSYGAHCLPNGACGGVDV